MRIAPIVLPLLLLVGCTIETRQAPPPAAPPPAAPPPAAAPPAPVATAAPPPAPATTVVGAPTTTSVDPLPPQPVVSEPPPPPAQISPVPNGNTIGVPPGLHPNSPPAYWIWRDPNGWWHVRTTSSKGSVHRFWGSASPQGATMAEVKGSRLEFNDRIKMTPKHAYWTFDTSGHSDGFDFRTSGAGQCVRFNLQGPANTNVYIGAKQFTPGTKHFELCP